MDERQIRALIVGRQFLDRVELLGANGTDPDRMGAVVLADLAVEMAAKAAVLDQPLPRKASLERDPALPTVLDALVEQWQARTATSEDVPEAREARRLHVLRNSVQHAGLVPSDDQVTDARLKARRFLAWVAKAWFGVELETISRARLIESVEVRKLVEDAERLAENEDYVNAGERLAVAFEFARREFRAGTSENVIHQVRPTDVSTAVSEVRKGGGDQVGLGYRAFDRVLRGFGHQIERLSDQIEALSFGARASDYAWFRRNFPRVHSTMRAGGEANLYTSPLPGVVISRPVYLRGLEFVTTTALHWQEFPKQELESWVHGMNRTDRRWS
jgi:hypothetical protein